MKETNSRCLILFAKEPVAGRVKTRLEPALGIDGALKFYRQMLKQQIELVNNYGNADHQLWIDGDFSHKDFAGFHGSFYSQQGDDIGIRMQQAMHQALQNYSSVVLIGSDCPGMNTAYLEDAFKGLECGLDVVLGPACDGGYVLIGLREPKAVFHGIDWGSARVMEQTRHSMRSNNLQWKELEALRDIDEPEDLKYLSEQMNEQLGMRCQIPG